MILPHPAFGIPLCEFGVPTPLREWGLGDGDEVFKYNLV